MKINTKYIKTDNLCSAVQKISDKLCSTVQKISILSNTIKKSNG